MSLTVKDHAERAIEGMNRHPFTMLQYQEGRDLEHRIRELEGMLEELREDIVWGTAYYVREPGARQKDAEYTLIAQERLRRLEELLGPAPTEIRENG